MIYNRPDPVHGVLIAAGRERHAALIDLVRAQIGATGLTHSKRARTCQDAEGTCQGTGNAGLNPRKQLLHLVFGGELSQLDTTEFKDLDKLDIVGIYPNYATAYAAWKAKAQQTVDNAQMRYFIVHLHRLLDPEAAARGSAR